MKIKKIISAMKAGNRININIPSQFIELLEIKSGKKNIEIELDTNKKVLTIRQLKENEDERKK